MGMVLSIVSGSLEHILGNGLCIEFSDGVVVLSKIGSKKSASTVVGEDCRGDGDVVRPYHLGEWTVDVFQNSLQRDQSLLWVRSPGDVHLPAKFDTPNEILFHGTASRNWKDDVGDIFDAASYLAHFQLQDGVGVFAWMASCEFGIGDVFLHCDLSETAQIDVCSSWDVVTQ